jgi:hypothetical protein
MGTTPDRDQDENRAVGEWAKFHQANRREGRKSTKSIGEGRDRPSRAAHGADAGGPGEACLAILPKGQTIVSHPKQSIDQPEASSGREEPKPLKSLNRGEDE